MHKLQIAILAGLCVLVCAATCFGQDAVSLYSAITNDTIEVRITGLGASTGDALQIVAKRRVDKTLLVTLDIGTVFVSASTNVQDMVGSSIRGERFNAGTFRPTSEIVLNDDQPRTYIVEAYCMNFHKANPGTNDLFTVSIPDQRAKELLSKARLANASPVVSQSALWIQRDRIPPAQIRQRFPVSDAELEIAQGLLPSNQIQGVSELLLPTQIDKPDLSSRVARRQGRSVALNERFCIVGGIEGEGQGYLAMSGYLYQRGTSNRFAKPLIVTAPDRGPFGLSVGGNARISMGGNVAAIALQDGIHVFRFDGKDWQEEALLQSKNPEDPNEIFGFSVATDGETIVSGVYHSVKDDSVQIYTFQDGSWRHQLSLTSPDPTKRDFGSLVALSEKTLLVGNEYSSSVVYVFQNTTNAWEYHTNLAPPLIYETNFYNKRYISTGKHFGGGMAISGNIAVIGARDGRCGTVYVFRRIQNNWTNEATLTVPPPCSNNSFGTAVAVERDTILIGAWGDGPKTKPMDSADIPFDAGAVYVFRFKNGSWGQTAKLQAPIPSAGGHFGFSIAINGETGLIGSWDAGGFALEENGGLKPLSPFVGGVHLFDLRPGS